MNVDCGSHFEPAINNGIISFIQCIIYIISYGRGLRSSSAYCVAVKPEYETKRAPDSRLKGIYCGYWTVVTTPQRLFNGHHLPSSMGTLASRNGDPKSVC